MCGIALIIDGISVDFCCVNSEQISSTAKSEAFNYRFDDLKAAILRRGPDFLGSKTLWLRSSSYADSHGQLSTIVEGDECYDGTFESKVHPQNCHCILHANGENGFRGCGFMHFIGAVLQLRGTHSVMQPLTDASGNILVYNGEIFGGLDMKSDDNDTEILMKSLGNCSYNCSSDPNANSCTRKQIPELLSSVKGPWTMIYWQESSKTLWFGRDAFGRRSLLVHWPTSEDQRLILSSVSPQSSSTGSEVEDGSVDLNYWEELPCGVYSVKVVASRTDGCLKGELKKHAWTDPTMEELTTWKRKFVEPIHDEIHSCGYLSHSVLSSCVALTVLRQSVARRTVEYAIFQAAIPGLENEVPAPVAVLFSGGLDSMILAALLHEFLDARYAIDLLNVSFEGDSAPDRITARAGVEELRRIAPLRRWRLVEIDSNLSNLSVEMKHVMSLINPAKTYMDLNIGTALWLASQGCGWVYENGDKGSQRVEYKSKARILLVGSGADEQCAGYGRHRTKYRISSWVGLNEEMKLDVQRIWKRNLGRDDRCIADNGKEARFPFLDEDVMRVLLGFPLWEIANLDQPSGTGDKKILREVAKLLGLNEAAVLPKKAIQFGSRIAQESNKKNFGSNRAANQASAGSVIAHQRGRKS